jgi:hypothetical protein
MKNFQKDGFVIFRNLINVSKINAANEEINAIPRSLLQEHLHKQTSSKRSEVVYWTFNQDAIFLNCVSNLFLNSRFTKSLRSILNTTDLIYFGDSTIMIGEAQRGFHKDNVHKNQNLEYSSDYELDYDLIRVGVYLQDVKNYSGGIQFRQGSHRFSGRWKGRIVNALMDKGDVVVWKLTTSHSGNSLIPRIFPSLKILPRITSYLPRFFFRPYQKNRIAIFLTFAAKNSKYLSAYLEDLKRRSYFRPFQANLVNKSKAQKFQKNGIKIISNLK